jgi:hypothetical protein
MVKAEDAFFSAQVRRDEKLTLPPWRQFGDIRSILRFSVQTGNEILFVF